MSVSNWNGSTQAFFELIEVTVNVYDKYVGTSGNGWIRGEVVVKNIGKVPLLDVYTRVDIDDNGNFWDGIFVTSGGSALPAPQTLTFGEVAVGATESQLFWYTVQSSISDIKPTETFTITAKAIPVFRVDTKGYGFVSNTTTVTTK